MTDAPHLRDLDLPNWYEVPKSVTIPAGTRYFRTTPSGEWATATPSAPVPPQYRIPGNRYFTAEPIPDPREAEIEAEAERLWNIFRPDYPWAMLVPRVDRTGFRRLAADSLDRQRGN